MENININIVRQFRLNQNEDEFAMTKHRNDIEFALDQALGNLRVWRDSLEHAGRSDVTYNASDMWNNLTDIIQKLEMVRQEMED